MHEEPGAAGEVVAERRTSPVELLWDLVFVFAITQVTALISDDLSWDGFGRGMLVLALIWWAWSAFVWAANAEAADSEVMRASLLAALVLIFLVAVALPEAYGDEAVLFACAYTGVRLLHLGLYADASRHGSAAWRVIAGFATTVIAGMALLVVGAFLGGAAQIVLWIVAVCVDYAGPGLLTRKRLRGLQQVAVAHFAERYGLFVIICLGESLIATGVATGGIDLTAGVVVSVILGVLLTVGLWWSYFDSSAGSAEQRLREHDDPVLAASDAYSYLHLPLIAGIIVFAVGIKATIHGYAAPLQDGPRLALCCGLAIYLCALSAFSMRMTSDADYRKLLAAAAMIAVYFLAGALAAWGVAAILTAMLAVLCATDVFVADVKPRSARGRARRSAA